MKKPLITLTALTISVPTFAFAPSSFVFGDNGCTDTLSFSTSHTDRHYFPPKITDHRNFVLLIQGDIRLTGGYMTRQGLYRFDNDYIQGEATMYRLKRYPTNRQYPALITPMNDGQGIACLVPKDKLGRYTKVR